ncbi:MAG: hypothetical protein MUE75_12560 [Algoriphagus sp.]|nr:hypothetical protein [Algoriphagus sp.]
MLKTTSPPHLFKSEWDFVRKGKRLFPVLLSGVALETQAVKLGLDPKDPGLNFAAALSNGLKDESVRKFVSENIQDQFDGDLNFLYYTTKGESLGGPNSKSITFEEALFGRWP